MTAGRRAWAEVLYDGADISEGLEPYLLGVTYTDHRGGKADEVTISLEDRDELWRGDWLPGVGATLTVRIHADDWGEGEGSLLCGTFTLDKLSLAGPPSTVQLSGVSVPTGLAARKTKRSRAWEQVTLRRVAEDVADSAGLSLVWDVDDDELPGVLDRVDQQGETDLAFLARLCRDYRLELKVHDGQLVVWDVTAYEGKDAVTTYTLGESRVLSWQLDVKAYMYTPKVKVQYRDPWLGDVQQATRDEAQALRGQSVDDPLGLDDEGMRQSFDDEAAEVIRQRARSQAEAEAKAKAALLRRQEHTVEGSLEVVGDVRLVAANPIALSGWGKLDGRYLLDRAVHTLGGGGYTVRAQIKRASP